MKIRKLYLLIGLLSLNLFFVLPSYAQEEATNNEIKIDSSKLEDMAKQIDDNTIIYDESKIVNKPSPSPNQNNQEASNVDSDPKSKEATGKGNTSNEAANEKDSSQADPGSKENSKPNKDAEIDTMIKNLDENTQEIKNVLDRGSKSDQVNPESEEKVSTKEETPKTLNNKAKENLDNGDNLKNTKEINSTIGDSIFNTGEKNNLDTRQEETITSKETLRSIFGMPSKKNKNLEVKLDDEEKNKKTQTTEVNYSNSIFSPQTIIIAITILAAILSAATIAIKDRKFNKKK